MSFTPLRDTLKDNSGKGKKPLADQAEAAMVLEHTQTVLSDMFGAELSRHAKPLYLKNRTLTITCASAAIAQEIRLNQGVIVEKINQKLGKKEVDRIRYLA